MKEKKILYLDNGGEPFGSVREAIGALNLIEFNVGDIVSAKYVIDGDKTDSVVAYGISDSSGYFSHKILSIQGQTVIEDIITDPERDCPDVTDVIHGELYILYNEDTYTYRLVSFDNPSISGRPGLRLIEVITKPITVINLADNGLSYRIIPGSPLVKPGDLYTKAQVDAKISALEAKHDADIAELKKSVFPVAITVDPIQGVRYRGSSTVVSEATLRATRSGADIIPGSKVYLRSHDVGGTEVQITPTSLGGGSYKITWATVPPYSKAWSTSVMNDCSVYTLRVFYEEEQQSGIVDNLKDIFVEYSYTGRLDRNASITTITGLLDYSDKTRLVIPRKDYSWQGISLDNKKSFFAFPVSFGELAHIYDDNGYDYINSYTKRILDKGTSTTENYYIYTLDNSTTITGFTQKFVWQ